MSWTLREHQHEPARMADLLYWGQLVEDDVVWQTDASLLSVLRYRGPDMESADAHELMALTARLHGVLLTLGGGWMVQAEARRHPAAVYPESRWSHPVAALIDEERRAQVGTPGTHFETSYHLALTRQIPRTLGSWWHHLWWEHIPEGHAQTDAVTNFREEVTRVTEQLRGILHEVEVLRGDALMTYLKSTVSASPQALVHVPEPPWYLGYQLTDTPLQAGVTPKLGPYWLRTVLVKNERRQLGYPETTYPGIVDILHDLGVEYRYVVRWIPLPYAKARKALSTLENVFLGQHKSFGTQFMEKMTGKGSPKVEHAAGHDAAAISAARALLDEGVINWGYLTLSVTVWDEDFTTAEQKRVLVEQALRAKGFLAAVEGLDAVGAWLGSIPGDAYHTVEKPPLTSLNLAHLMPTTSVWAGPQWVPHLSGPPLLVGTARGQTPFRLTTHEGDVGDCFIAGPKGSGKSSLLALMALQWQRYTSGTPPRVVAFDKGQSLRAATLAMDGTWIALAPGASKPLQPLARINDGEERAWAGEWLGDLFETEGVALTPEVKHEVWGALETLATFPVQQRTLSGFVGLVQRTALRQALMRYTVDGPFGQLLDGDEDWLRVTHWTCFEMEKLLDDFPRLVHPVAKVIFRRVETALDGGPTFISLDECHAYFAQEVLARRLLSWLKTFRRRNALLAFATQNLTDIKNSPIGDEIIQACPTRIYCPNPHALEPYTMAIYQQFGLSVRQCELIARSIPKRQYYYQGQQGNRLMALDLRAAGLAFCGRSRLEDLQRMARVDRERTEPFSVAWLREERLEDLAQLLGEAYDHEQESPAASGNLVAAAAC